MLFPTKVTVVCPYQGLQSSVRRSAAIFSNLQLSSKLYLTRLEFSYLQTPVVQLICFLCRELFRKNGRKIKEGDVIKRTKYGKTLRKIADSGADLFYTGKMAKKVTTGLKVIILQSVNVEYLNKSSKIILSYYGCGILLCNGLPPHPYQALICSALNNFFFVYLVYSLAFYFYILVGCLMKKVIKNCLERIV